MKTIILLGVLLSGMLAATTLVGRRQSEQVFDKVSRKAVQIAPHYMEYSDETFTQAKRSGRTVLFFWAPWCSTCTLLDDELRQRSSELPDDVTILKVNFDTQKDLKQKYFVTQQHTLVQIDKNGNQVTKWIGGGVDLLKQQLKEI